MDKLNSFRALVKTWIFAVNFWLRCVLWVSNCVFSTGDHAYPLIWETNRVILFLIDLVGRSMRLGLRVRLSGVGVVGLAYRLCSFW